MKEIFDLMREQMEKNACHIGIRGEDGHHNVVGLCTTYDIINEAEAKWKEDCCEWKWGIDYAQVQCRGDKILFGSRRLFTYCPYCGKTIAEVE